MKIERICANPKCGATFQPKRTDQIYHNDSCKVAVYRARVKEKALGQVPNGEKEKTVSTSLMKTNTLQSPEQLPISAKFIIDELTRQRDKFETTNEAYASEIKKLREEKAQLEKDLDKAQREVDEKPSGLSGFISNPDNVKSFMTELPTTLAGVAELIKSMRGEPAQQTNALPPHKEHDLIVWLKTQPVTVQHGFIDIVRGFIQTPDRVEDFIAHFKKSMISAGVNFHKTGTE